jgi:hypothetical protein
LLTGELVVTAPTLLLSLAPGSETIKNRMARRRITADSQRGYKNCVKSYSTIKKNYSPPKALEKFHY